MKTREIVRIFYYNTLICEGVLNIRYKKWKVTYFNEHSFWVPINLLKTFEGLKEWFESRQVDLDRVDRAVLLGYKEGSPPLTIWEEMRLTYGYDYDDYFWVDFFQGEGRFKCIEDFHPSVEGYRGGVVYMGLQTPFHTHPNDFRDGKDKGIETSHPSGTKRSIDWVYDLEHFQDFVDKNLQKDRKQFLNKVSDITSNSNTKVTQNRFILKLGRENL